MENATKMFYTTEDVRALFGGKISKGSVLNAIHAGKIKSVSFNRRKYVPKCEYDKLIAMATGQKVI